MRTKMTRAAPAKTINHICFSLPSFFLWKDICLLHFISLLDEKKNTKKIEIILVMQYVIRSLLFSYRKKRRRTNRYSLCLNVI